jgi:quinol monooxygenase YgiN
MIHVLAIITAHPGKRTELLELFHAVIPIVRAEQGCIEYGVAVDVPKADPAFGPDTYVVVEKWESMETLQAHAAAPHMKAFGAAAGPLIAKRAVHVMEPAP